MEKTKETPRLLLAQCLKELVSRGVSFEKITIKDITDEAGLIRPTFYNHFQDKYELLEWIWRRQILDPLRPLLQAGMTGEAVRLLFARLEADKAFYQRAFKIEGQNSFADIVLEQTAAFLGEHMKKSEGLACPLSPLLTNRNIALYCANNLLFVIRRWALGGFKTGAAQVAQVYIFMITHSPEELLRPSLDPEGWAAAQGRDGVTG